MFMLCTEMHSDQTTGNKAYTAEKLAAGVEYILNSKYSTIGLGSQLS
jgi:hypothetical protein